MNILALDTCLGACSVAMTWSGGEGGARVAAERELMTQGHAEALMPMIDRVREALGAELRRLDRIAVTVGPGTFTGVRIGVGAARAFALATGAAVVGFSSLLPIALATAARAGLTGDADAGARDAIAVAMDGRQGLLFVQIVSPAGEELTRPMLLAPGEAARLVPERRLLATGTGAPALLAALASAGRRDAGDLAARAAPEDVQPHAAALIGPARTASPTAAAALRPLYLRAPDAKPQADQSLPRASR